MQEEQKESHQLGFKFDSKRWEEKEVFLSGQRDAKEPEQAVAKVYGKGHESSANGRGQTCASLAMMGSQL